jgi:hypothetical protein
LLAETVGALFGNPRDEKLHRVIRLTYCEPGLKQEAVAERLSLSFGTYRRQLDIARERLARWLWENSQVARAQPEPASAAGITPREGDARAETAILTKAGESAPPRLSIVVLPFVNIAGSAEDDPFVDGEIAQPLRNMQMTAVAPIQCMIRIGKGWAGRRAWPCAI